MSIDRITGLTAVQVQEAIYAAVHSSPSNDPVAKTRSLEMDRLLKSSPRSWPHLIDCLRASLSNDHLAFYCLSVLEYYTKNGERMDGLRQEFVNLMLQWQDGQVRLGGFVRNKAAQVIVRLISNEYLDSWMSAFKEMTEWWQKSALHADLMLRVCLALNEELVDMNSIQAHRNTLIKDRLRNGDVNSLVNIWGLLITDFSQSFLVRNSLKCISGCAPWIDVSLTANPELLSKIYGCLESIDFRSDAIDCLTAIVGKGMPIGEKLKLMTFLNLPSIFTGALSMREQDQDFFEKTCKLLNVAGVEITSSAYSIEGHQYLIQILCPLLTRFLTANDSIECSLILAPFACGVGEYLRSKQSPEDNQSLFDLLKAIVKIITYPDDFDFDSPGETEELFPDIRQSYMSAFDHLYMMCSASQFILGMIIKGSQSGDDREKELSLYLLYRYCDFNRGYTFQMTIGMDKKTTPLGQTVLSVLNSPVNIESFCYPSYLDCAGRFSQTTFFDLFPSTLPTIMDNIVMGFGAVNPESKKKAFSIFNKIIKSGKTTRTDEAIRSVFMSVDDPIDVFTAKLEFFEAYGMCSAKQGSSDDLSVYQQVISSPQVDVKYKQRAVKAVGAYLKGYGEVADMNKVARFAVVSVSLLDSHPSWDTFDACRYFCQRVIGVLRGQSIPLLQKLVTWSLSCNEDTVLSSMLPVLSASIFKLKTEISPMMHELWIPLGQAIERACMASGQDESHAVTELRRQSMAMYIALFSANIMAPLLQLDLQHMINTTFSALRDESDFSMKRSALSVFSRSVATIQSIDFLQSIASNVLPSALKDLRQMPSDMITESTFQAFISELCNLISLLDPFISTNVTYALQSASFTTVSSNRDQKLLKSLFMQSLNQ